MTRHPEMKRTTQDGTIWPVLRPFMRDREAIRTRMVEDLFVLRAETGPAQAITSEDLVTRFGWARRQVEAHASAAFESFKALRRANLQPESACEAA